MSTDCSDQEGLAHQSSLSQSFLFTLIDRVKGFYPGLDLVSIGIQSDLHLAGPADHPGTGSPAGYLG